MLQSCQISGLLSQENFSPKHFKLAQSGPTDRYSTLRNILQRFRNYLNEDQG